MQYGCIGEHLGHSFSKEIHALIGSYPYRLQEIPRKNLDAFFRERSFIGINVTIPYKEAVIPYLSGISEQARTIGAVNTVVNREGKLYGYNTDYYGLSELIQRIGVNPAGKKVAVLGTGGTSLTACAVAKGAGAASVIRVSRSGKDGAVTYEELYEKHSDIQFLINTTPCGMYPHTEECPVVLSAFPALEAVADAVYNPLRTTLVLSARQRNIPAQGGLYMLVSQAVRASEIFRNNQSEPGTAERVFRTIRQSKENIVLTGMPGSGKSTVGKLLAAQMGRELTDTDMLIEQTANKSVSQIFAESGEAGFRDIETQVIRKITDRTGLIVATGGGAVLRDENIGLLRRNGRLYFLDRPPETLLPTDDRPLAQTAEELRNRYRERYSRYRETADFRVDAPESALEAAERVRKDFEQR